MSGYGVSGCGGKWGEWPPSCVSHGQENSKIPTNYTFVTSLKYTGNTVTNRLAWSRIELCQFGMDLRAQVNSRTSEFTSPSGNDVVRISEMSITLKLSAYLKIFMKNMQL